MFDGFVKKRIKVSSATINLVVGGMGPPLLLLHGNPQTHIMWHKVAPKLAEKFTVIASDLRGYGDSSKPMTLSKNLLALYALTKSISISLGSSNESMIADFVI